MEYVIAILICLLYFKYYIVDIDLPKTKIDAYLTKNNLTYVKHERIEPDTNIKQKFFRDVNPFLFLFYGIQYYRLLGKDSKDENVKIYIKRYQQRALFNKSKVYFVRD